MDKPTPTDGLQGKPASDKAIGLAPGTLDRYLAALIFTATHGGVMTTFTALKDALNAGYMVDHSIPGGYFMRRRTQHAHGEDQAIVAFTPRTEFMEPAK